MQTILLGEAMANVEPILLRERLLHTAAPIIRRGRRTLIKIGAGCTESIISSPRWPASPGSPTSPYHLTAGLARPLTAQGLRRSGPKAGTTACPAKQDQQDRHIPGPTMIVSGK